jgi:hypothetical protein
MMHAFVTPVSAKYVFIWLRRQQLTESSPEWLTLRRNIGTFKKVGSDRKWSDPGVQSDYFVGLDRFPTKKGLIRQLLYPTIDVCGIPQD